MNFNIFFMTTVETGDPKRQCPKVNQGTALRELVASKKITAPNFRIAKSRAKCNDNNVMALYFLKTDHI